MQADNRHLPLLLSASQPCSYLPGNLERLAVIDPAQPITPAIYQALLARGLRRSGPYLYRPHCDDCTECIPLRTDSRAFRMRRRQRRIWKRLAEEVTTSLLPIAEDNDREAFDLYRRYMAFQHPGSCMGEADYEDFRRSFQAPWSQTYNLRIYFRQRLMSIAVTDLLADSLSAVYTYYAPEFADLSPGVFSIMKQLQLARESGRDWLYLGLWIRDCQKMNYKTQYQPAQGWIDSRWQRLAPDPTGKGR
jgi:arginyl-tRNA--protein-N-Asp/Glu arginylyltransferase